MLLCQCGGESGSAWICLTVRLKGQALHHGRPPDVPRTFPIPASCSADLNKEEISHLTTLVFLDTGDLWERLHDRSVSELRHSRNVIGLLPLTLDGAASSTTGRSLSWLFLHAVS